MTTFYKVQIAISIILLLLAEQSVSQTYKGEIFNELTSLPVEYVTIGIPNLNVGTLSNKNGQFSLKIDSLYNKLSLHFSCIGYRDTSVLISKFKQEKEIRIFLKQKIYQLDEITINPGNYKQITFNSINKERKSTYYFDFNSEGKIATSDNFGAELGIFIKNKKEVSLQSLFFTIASCSFDSILLRINIYEVNGKLKYQNLPDDFIQKIEEAKKERDNYSINFSWEYLNESKETRPNRINREPIYLKILKFRNKEKSFKIELSNYNLTVNSDFLIGFEMVDVSGKGELNFSGVKDDCYFRNTGFGLWTLFPIAPSYKIVGLIDRNK